MRRIFPVFFLGFAVIIVLPSASNDTALRAQEPQLPSSSQGQPQTTLPVVVNLVSLQVSVKDQNGALVSGLQSNEFRIFDDGVEQKLSFFSTEELPLSLVVLVDDDLKSAEAEQMVASLHALAAGMSADDEAEICHFDLKFYPGDGFTKDLDHLFAEIKIAQNASAPSTSGPVPFVTGPSWHKAGVGEPLGDAAPTKLGARPTKALDDAIFSAAELLQDRGLTRRKIILVISDGINGREFNQHSYNETLEEVLRVDSSVFGVSVGRNSFYKMFARLRSYATDSGGDIYYGAKTGDMEKLYSKIGEQARHEYILAYSPRGNDAKAAYHKIEVRTTREGLQVKTRRGYYSTPNTASPEKTISSAGAAPFGV